MQPQDQTNSPIPLPGQPAPAAQPTPPDMPPNLTTAATPPATQPVVDDTLAGQKVNNPLESMRPGEKVLCEIKRHPIGLLGMYIGAGLVILLIAVVGYGIAPAVVTDYTKSQIYGISTLVLLVAAIFCLIALYISHTVYWGNRWIVTSDSITQVSQISLFSKQSSQLSMGNLEDITAEKNGILPHMFNFGDIWAETAGERDKFRFNYCPNPDYYAKVILSAREAFEQTNYRSPSEQAQAYPSNTAGYQPPQQ